MPFKYMRAHEIKNNLITCMMFVVVNPGGHPNGATTMRPNEVEEGKSPETLRLEKLFVRRSDYTCQGVVTVAFID